MNINHFTFYFKGDIVDKFSSWFGGWIESTFTFTYALFYTHFVSSLLDRE